MKMLFFGLLMVAGLAQAEEKTCEVKGMHCKGCTEMVEAKVCGGDKYSTCKSKIVSEKKEMGEIHIVTKDASSKIDENAVKAAVEDAGYTLKSCKSGGKG